MLYIMKKLLKDASPENTIGWTWSVKCEKSMAVMSCVCLGKHCAEGLVHAREEMLLDTFMESYQKRLGIIKPYNLFLEQLVI